MDNNYILSFLGIAPMDNPQVGVYLAIDNPKGTIQYGGVDSSVPLIFNITIVEFCLLICFEKFVN